MPDDVQVFTQRVAEVDRRVRELTALGDEIILRSEPEDTVTWDRGHYRATLELHTAEKLPRLSLFLHTGSQMHPSPLQIGLYDADVVEMVAEPVAGLLSGSVTE